MLRIASSVELFIHRISLWIRWISMGSLFLMMFFVTAGVIARYIMHKPIKGDMEIQELAMVLVVFVAFPFLQSEKGNVYVELLLDRLKGRSKAIMGSFAYLLGMIIIALLVWQTGVKAARDFASFGSNVTLSLYIPISPFILIADIGMGLFGIEWLIELIHYLYRAVVNKQPQKSFIPEHETVGSN